MMSDLVDVETLRSVADEGSLWRRSVDELNHSSLAHAAEWFTVIRNAYGHDPLYLSAEDKDGQRGLLPAFIVRRPLLGGERALPSRPKQLTWPD